MYVCKEGWMVSSPLQDRLLFLTAVYSIDFKIFEITVQPYSRQVEKAFSYKTTFEGFEKHKLSKIIGDFFQSNFSRMSFFQNKLIENTLIYCIYFFSHVHLLST